jgi:hypothetical protein
MILLCFGMLQNSTSRTCFIPSCDSTLAASISMKIKLEPIGLCICGWPSRRYLNELTLITQHYYKYIRCVLLLLKKSINKIDAGNNTV